MDYAILDVETSGGKFNEESLIEIAIYRFDGEKITDSFSSLVNPEKEIHFYVQKLTGITQKMVKTSPKFYELAKRIVEITDDAILVGHNISFDYRVIRSEFSRLGYDYQRPTLDTITLSRNLIPGMTSYSLGKLCDSLGIPVSDRHRAHGDARATVKLFQLLLAKDLHKNIIGSSIKHSNYQSLNKKILSFLEKLPLETGVFYFHDENDKIIYIDKGLDISTKARQILTSKSKRSRILQVKTKEISFELTGNEIIANIKALNEIKINRPLYKPTKENYTTIFGIFFTPPTLSIDFINFKNKKHALFAFETLDKAEDVLLSLQKKIDSGFNILSEINFQEDTYILLTDKGRTFGEKSFLFFENGHFKGYGFYSLHSQIKNVEQIKKIMVPSTINSEILLQIRNKFFISNKLQKIVISEPNLFN